MCIITLSAALGTSIATAVGVSVAAGTVAGTAVAGATVAGAATAITAGTAVAIGATAIGVGVLSVAGAVAGGVVGIVQGAQSAEAQKQQAEYMADVAEQNAKMAYRRAENLELQGNQKRAALLREMQQKKGTGRANYAAGGVVLGGGTTAEYEGDIANAYDLDLRNLNYDIASEAWQSKVQGVSESNQAALYRAQAGAASQQKTMSILGGTIKTIGDTAGTIFSMGMGLSKFGGGSAAGGTGWTMSGVKLPAETTLGEWSMPGVKLPN